ncbi:MAG: hypothetical protein R3F59_38315 [Myxococcota bacterium]
MSAPAEAPGRTSRICRDRWLDARAAGERPLLSLAVHQGPAGPPAAVASAQVEHVERGGVAVEVSAPPGPRRGRDPARRRRVGRADRGGRAAGEDVDWWADRIVGRRAEAVAAVP